MNAYSLDFRKLVVAYAEEGYSQAKAAEVLGVSMRPITIRKKMDKEGKNWYLSLFHEVRIELITKNVGLCERAPDAYLREIAAHFSVGLTTIWNALHRLGARYKNEFIFHVIHISIC